MIKRRALIKKGYGDTDINTIMTKGAMCDSSPHRQKAFEHFSYVRGGDKIVVRADGIDFTYYIVKAYVKSGGIRLYRLHKWSGELETIVLRAGATQVDAIATIESRISRGA